MANRHDHAFTPCENGSIYYQYDFCILMQIINKYLGQDKNKNKAQRSVNRDFPLG